MAKKANPTAAPATALSASDFDDADGVLGVDLASVGAVSADVGLVLDGPPSASEIDQAADRAAQALGERKLSPGSVIGLPEGWKAYVLDLAVGPGRVEHWRANLRAKGYRKAAGLKVAGIAMPEVWVVPTVVYEQQIFAARQARDDKRRKSWRMRQISENTAA